MPRPHKCHLPSGLHGLLAVACATTFSRRRAIAAVTALQETPVPDTASDASKPVQMANVLSEGRVASGDREMKGL